MIQFIVFTIVFWPTIKALCYSPVMHGLAPDVILPHMLSSEVFCPTPYVFDYFNCICVDASELSAPVAARVSLDLSLMRAGGESSRHPSYLTGLPDTHDARFLWTPVTVGRARLVPELNPYISYNLPTNSNVLKATVKAKARLWTESAAANKQLEMLEKVRWQQQLEREAAVVAAVAAVGGGPVTVAVVGSSASLDGFMRDTLRRILYG